MNQCEMILKYIGENGSITTLDAFRELGITRLASRIHDLSDAGYRFNRETITKKNRYGDKVHFTKYSLQEKRNE